MQKTLKRKRTMLCLKIKIHTERMGHAVLYTQMPARTLASPRNLPARRIFISRLQLFLVATWPCRVGSAGFRSPQATRDSSQAPCR